MPKAPPSQLHQNLWGGTPGIMVTDIQPGLEAALDGSAQQEWKRIKRCKKSPFFHKADS